MFLEKAFYGKTEWYWYVLSILIIFTAWQFIGAIPYFGYVIVTQWGDFSKGITANMLLPKTNFGLALFLVSTIAGFFAVFACVKYIHQRPYNSVVTGRNRVDYKRILFSTGVWAILSLLAMAVTVLTSSNSELVFQFDPVRFFGLLVVCLLFLPFQTTFEELFFRGYLMQGLGLIFRYRWIPLLITSIIFGLMHAVNPEVEAFGIWVAMPQYILMGLILGYVALKDDGLELAIGLHMANNILAAITVTSDASVLQTAALYKDMNPTVSHWDTLAILITGIIFIAICNWKYKFIHNINLWKKITKPDDLAAAC